MLDHETLTIVHTPLDEISQHPENANEGDVDLIAESIEMSGYYAPVIVQSSSGYILSGNHRWLAMKALGAVTIPAIFVDVDDLAAKRIMAADNRITRLGIDDPALLANLLDQLADTDEGLLGTGFDNHYLQTLLESLDEKLEFDEEPDRKATGTSDLYEVFPEKDDDEHCTALTIEFEDGSFFSAADYNRIRQALGLHREGEAELRAHEIEDWL